MATLVSVRDKSLIRHSATPQKNAENSVIAAPAPTRPSAPGRITISAPAKPAATDRARLRPTTSRRSGAASTVANSGAVNDSAVTVASGASDSAVKNASIAPASVMPRSTSKPGRRGRSCRKPAPASSGTTKASPKRLRKKAIWNG